MITYRSGVVEEVSGMRRITLENRVRRKIPGK